MRKKRVLIHSDFALAKTGFGRAAKALLTKLYKTDKYELYQLCCGANEKDGSKALNATPWKSFGAITDKILQAQNNKDKKDTRMVSYGSERLDELVKEIKPDVYIGIQDFWGLNYSIEKKWFRSISSAIWTTLDSLPILKSARDDAPKIKNYWVWSNFAEKALHKEGYKHVQTVHGPIDTEKFYRLSDSKRLKLRQENNIPEDAFIIGFVFRNQLRKLVPNLMEGYKLWKEEHPEIKNTYLLLHTSLAEGWNIPEQAKIHGIPNSEILLTHICTKCLAYDVRSFDQRGENIFEEDENGNIKKDEHGKSIEKPLNLHNKDCRFCRTKGSQQTCSTQLGISEEELNEVYNLMDVYAHPFTSGGQEIPIQEAKLTELITLVTNYSCGEEACEPEAGSLPLKWSKYLEHGTEFIKASTYPESIKDQLNNFLKMTRYERAEMGKKARKWVIDNFSSEVISRKIEKFIDDSPFINEEDESNFANYSGNAPANPHIQIESEKDPIKWISSLYEKILSREVSKNLDGVNYWLKELAKGDTDEKRKQIENFFRKTATEEVSKSNSNKENEKSLTLDSFLIKNGKKRILFNIPKSIGDCFLSTALFEPLRELYPPEEWDLYVSSEAPYQKIFDGNKHITKWIPFNPAMQNVLAMEGFGPNKGYFDICFVPHGGTQIFIDYTHNGKDKFLF